MLKSVQQNDGGREKLKSFGSGALIDTEPAKSLLIEKRLSSNIPRDASGALHTETDRDAIVVDDAINSRPAAVSQPMTLLSATTPSAAADEITCSANAITPLQKFVDPRDDHNDTHVARAQHDIPNRPTTSSKLDERPRHQDTASGDLSPESTAVIGRALWDLRHLADLQDNVTTHRLHAQQLRSRTQHGRGLVARADTLLMDYVRHCYVVGKRIDAGHLDMLYEECQKVRDSLGPLEQEYEESELRLGRMEYAVSQEARRLHRLHDLHQVEHVDASELMRSNPSHISFESSTSDQVDTVIDAAAGRSTLRFGNDIAVGEFPIMKPDPNKAEEVHGSQDANSVSGQQDRDSRDTVVSDTESLRLHALEDQLLVLDEPVEQPYYGAVFDSGMTSMISSHHESPIFGVFSKDPKDLDTRLDSVHSNINGLLLDAEPEDTSDDIEGYLPRFASTQALLREYLLEFTSSHNRVNKWILHNLRLSYLECLLHYTQAPDGQPLAMDRPTSALNLWDVDEAATSPKGALFYEQSVYSSDNGDQPSVGVAAVPFLLGPRTNHSLSLQPSVDVISRMQSPENVASPFRPPAPPPTHSVLPIHGRHYPPT